VRPGEPAPSLVRAARARRRPSGSALRHLTVDVAAGVEALVAAVDAALAAGTVPAVPSELVGRARRPPRAAGGTLDPELWSTTA
jgi:hypothetical protein